MSALNEQAMAGGLVADDANRSDADDARLDVAGARGSGRRPLMDARQAGMYTGLGERYIRRLRAERRIACVKFVGRLLFDPDDLDRLIDLHRETASSEVSSSIQ